MISPIPSHRPTPLNRHWHQFDIHPDISNKWTFNTINLYLSHVHFLLLVGPNMRKRVTQRGDQNITASATCMTGAVAHLWFNPWFSKLAKKELTRRSRLRLRTYRGEPTPNHACVRRHRENHTTHRCSLSTRVP